MPDLLVRNIEEKIVNVLKSRAAGNGRSLQQEVRTILEDAAASRTVDSLALAARIRARLARGHSAQTDSVELVREDRDG